MRISDWSSDVCSSDLLDCVQMGTIEFHAWACHQDSVEQPDRMIFDLDPDEGLDFAEVKRAAGDLRGRLEDAGLASFPMLTGGKGIHLVVPLDRKSTRLNSSH